MLPHAAASVSSESRSQARRASSEGETASRSPSAMRRFVWSMSSSRVTCGV